MVDGWILRNGRYGICGTSVLACSAYNFACSYVYVGPPWQSQVRRIHIKSPICAHQVLFVLIFHFHCRKQVKPVELQMTHALSALQSCRQFKVQTGEACFTALG